MSISRSYLYRILKSIKDRGIMRTVKLVYAERLFEWRLGTDTAGIVHLHELEIASPNKAVGVRYEGSNLFVFRDLIRQIPITDFCDRTFLDFGCGKGRAMMLAATHGFRNIIGVDFSKDLCDSCQRNLKQYQRSTRTVSSFEVVQSDVVEYQIPSEVTVFFFNNPFGLTVLARVIDNIQASLAETPRQIWVLYENALHHDLFVSRGFRVLFRQEQNCLRIYPDGAAIYTIDAPAPRNTEPQAFRQLAQHGSER